MPVFEDRFTEEESERLRNGRNRRLPAPNVPAAVQPAVAPTVAPPVPVAASIGRALGRFGGRTAESLNAFRAGEAAKNVQSQQAKLDARQTFREGIAAGAENRELNPANFVAPPPSVPAGGQLSNDERARRETVIPAVAQAPANNPPGQGRNINNNPAFFQQQFVQPAVNEARQALSGGQPQPQRQSRTPRLVNGIPEGSVAIVRGNVNAGPGESSFLQSISDPERPDKELPFQPGTSLTELRNISRAADPVSGEAAQFSRTAAVDESNARANQVSANAQARRASIDSLKTRVKVNTDGTSSLALSIVNPDGSFTDVPDFEQFIPPSASSGKPTFAKLPPNEFNSNEQLTRTVNGVTTNISAIEREAELISRAEALAKEEEIPVEQALKKIRKEFGI